ncbi:RNA-directed DNA polymerase from mobile element jockey [Labeo rohita]|uniref:RNA-directed DNA polymerase from mobile element jockey n=1 Tax=Labeo rohita TaxID=84645 RepID=A0ABQ8LGF0_LABRO|nr:RNA-directed DNA polymerase from mobile element jockey [Labeo rohita]
MRNLSTLIVITLTTLWIIHNNLALALLTSDQKLLTYSRADLLQLRSSALCQQKPPVALPPEIKLRRRGRRGANVRSLRNKMDLLHAKCSMERGYKDACIIVLTETWLDEEVPESEVSLDHFTILRADRTHQSGKVRGGGICIYVNNRWCDNIKIHNRICTPDVEMMTVSLRPFHLPREFQTVVVTCVYICPSANARVAAELVADNANTMLAAYPEAPAFILGDFNNCRLNDVLPSFHQFVDVPTRKENTLDLCYGNVAGAYTARAFPPLGFSDHNVIFLLPQYKPKLKRIKPTIYSATLWSEDAIEQLQGSLACTDWGIFQGTLDERVSTITDYIKFCIHTTIPTRTVKRYPNSKPWITPHIKYALKEKRAAFKKKDWVTLKILNRQIKNDIIRAKMQYKNKLEQEFSNMNTKQAFQKIKKLTGQEQNHHHQSSPDPLYLANTLNSFFNRFDTHDHTPTCEELLRTLPIHEPQHPPFTEEDVQWQLARCKAGKAPGPDGIPAKVLKCCAMELSSIFHSIFWESYRTATIPTLWKTSTITPVPKKPHPSEPNHYRPVALTPIVMKCMEKIILQLILPTVSTQLDSYQFAYRPKRGTEDAVACLLHSLLHHLQTPHNFASVLFVDFSSAFNTIQRHLLIKKLQHLNVTPLLIHWINNFLSSRPQTSSLPNTTYYKYADDTAIVGLLKDNSSITAYHQSITDFTLWCSDNYLQLNTDKTKELVIHASKSPPGFTHITIHGQPVEQVSTFKYLGLTIDNKLNFNEHVTITQKRAQQRLYAIRKLRSLHVAPHLLLLLYKSIIQPLLLYCSPCFFTTLSVTSKNKLIKFSHLASKIIQLPTPSLTDANDTATTRLARTIASSPDHPLNRFFTLLPSGRRYRALDWKKAHFKKSFVPSAITALNKLL